MPRLDKADDVGRGVSDLHDVVIYQGLDRVGHEGHEGQELGVVEEDAVAARLHLDGEVAGEEASA